MILRYLIFNFLLVASINSYSQFSLEVGTGLNRSNLEFKGDKQEIHNFNYEYVNNYFVGLRPTILLGEKWKAALEVQYSKKGYQNSELVSKSSVNYIDLIPQIQYQLINLISLNFGIHGGFKVDERLTFSEIVSEFGLFKENALGYNAGVSLHLTRALNVKLQYYNTNNPSFLEFTNSSGQGLDIDNKMKNFQIGIYYAIL
jgi:opacity protein-like surface antigen